MSLFRSGVLVANTLWILSISDFGSFLGMYRMLLDGAGRVLVRDVTSEWE